MNLFKCKYSPPKVVIYINSPKMFWNISASCRKLSEGIDHFLVVQCPFNMVLNLQNYQVCVVTCLQTKCTVKKRNIFLYLWVHATYKKHGNFHCPIEFAALGPGLYGLQLNTPLATTSPFGIFVLYAFSIERAVALKRKQIREKPTSEQAFQRPPYKVKCKAKRPGTR